MGTTSLLRRKHEFARAQRQVDILSATESIPTFQRKLQEHNLGMLQGDGLEVMQVNVGKMCNQVCKHCHVDAGPDRKEIMTRETMELCLHALKQTTIETVDLTGGAPEMNPHFRWFVEQISAMDRKIIVRCNLTIILANPKYHDLPEFFKRHKVHVVSSLPYFTARRTNAQRGDGVFERSIKALKMLNKVGYGIGTSDLLLDLVYNPTGAFLPGDQGELETEFKRKLKSLYDIDFNQLFAITNIPVSRFLDYLIQSDNYEQYMDELANAFNPLAAHSVMCKTMISIGWDGFLYDCDFNQMLDLKLNGGLPAHIRDFDYEKLSKREITMNRHCFGCTAGAGSSCGGSTT
jgi:radical SAM/Cys-rich protein